MQLFPLNRFAYQLVHRIVQKIKNEGFPFNEKGFGGGAPKPPSVPAPPAIAPSPVPTETKPGANLEGRQRQIAMLKYGSLSTITNSGGSSGISGVGSDFYPTMTAGTSGKQTIGG